MRKQLGFSLLEVFISLSIGVVLLAGVLSIFVGMRTTSSETSSYGEMQETGRFVVSLLSDDLMRQGFWGEMIEPLSFSNLISVTGVEPAGECTGEGINNGSFPENVGHFRTIWGRTLNSSSALDCINNAKINSEVLQIKRTAASPTTGARDANKYYLVNNLTTGQIIDGGEALPTISNSQVWEYLHHVYYVSEEKVGDEIIPSLTMRSLQNTWYNQPIADGVEFLHIMYGIDVNNDGMVNTFVAADNMTQAFWDREFQANIRAVKIFVLVRDIYPDYKYTNNITYQMGDATFTAQGDNYRRILFSSTISLHNGDVEIW